MEGLFDKTKLHLKRSSPVILTIFSIIGLVGTVVTAIKATPKAVEIVRDNSGIDHDGIPFTPTKREIVKQCWPCYIPTVLVGLSTITCIMGINAFSKRNQASLASAYSLLSESYRQYKKAANVVYGEDANSKIKVQIAKDSYVSADGCSIYDSGLDTESDKILCYDLFSSRYFTTTMAAVLNAQYHVNRNLCLRGYVAINEFYEFLGLDLMEFGDEMGWSLDDMMETGIMWLDFENRYAEMDDGMNCCVISALWDPQKF